MDHSLVIFRPRLKPEIEAGLVARTVARGPFTDVSETGQLSGLLAEVATDVASIEERMHRIRRSFDFMDSFGADLDARVADLPKAPWATARLARIGASAASGSVLTLTNSSASDVAVPAGSVFSRNDGSAVRYVLVSDVTVTASSSATGTITATTLGTAGNAGANIIDVIQSAPDGITCNNLTAISGGVERETDDELKQRALRHLGGLAGVQPDALIALALSFVSSDGVRVRHASVFADPDRRGYFELMVDDGTGFSGFTRTGLANSYTVPIGGGRLMLHESPATAELSQGQVTVDVGGAGAPAAVALTSAGELPWVSMPERGELWFNSAYLAAGDVVYVGDTANGCSSYDVYVGAIAELQALIEGSAALGTVGNISAGCRGRVIPPDVEALYYSTNLVAKDGYDLVALRTIVQNEAVEYHRAYLGPGVGLRINDLARYLMSLDGVHNITFNQTNSSGTAVTYRDRNPATLRKALRVVQAADFEVV